MIRAALLALVCGVLLHAHAAPYEGPIFDAHLHYNDDAVQRYSTAAAFELFRKSGVRAILANSRPNDGSRALYESALRQGQGERIAVIPFIRVYRNRDDYGTWFDNPEIHRMIVDEEKRGYYRGIGEFHVFGRHADTKVVKDIVDFSVAKGFFLHAHCDEEALEILFAHNPKARVIWAHTGFTTPLARVEELLAKYPALWGELSYRMDVAEEGHLAPGWKALFSRHPTRFVVGSDTWVNPRWESYPQLMSGYRAWLGDLPPATAERIAWRNAAELFAVK
jgi:amidohydrolase family protein